MFYHAVVTSSTSRYHHLHQPYHLSLSRSTHAPSLFVFCFLNVVRPPPRSIQRSSWRPIKTSSCTWQRKDGRRFYGSKFSFTASLYHCSVQNILNFKSHVHSELRFKLIRRTKIKNIILTAAMCWGLLYCRVRSAVASIPYHESSEALRVRAA